jgi:hypothetical protein
MHTPSCFKICVAALVPATLLLQGCPGGQPGGTANIIQSIEIDQNFLLSVGVPSLGTAIPFIIRGAGGCPAKVNWGDGSTEEPFLNLSGGADTVTHTFTGWSGGKTVSVVGRPPVSPDCIGGDTVRFNIPPTTLSFGLSAEGGPACKQITAPSRPAVRPGWMIEIRTVLLPRYPNGINFGCSIVPPCVLDAHGKDPAPAGAGFPFPTLRPFSLVLRIAESGFQPQIVQGDTYVRFETVRTGPLEICLNDDDMTDNLGGYELQVQVDQLGK